MKKMQFIVALLCAMGSATAFGQAYPIKPVRIVTSPAGGGNDFPARLVAQGISGALGQQVIVENRATTLIGEIVARSAPDGYTLLVSGSPHWIGPLIDKSNYHPINDFAPISILDKAAIMMVVHPSMPVKNVKDLIALARARPGEMNYSSGGTGGSNHLGGLLFNHFAKVDIVRVPYKGSNPAMTAVMAGEVQVMFPSAGGAVPFVKSGRLRALAVGSAQRSAFAPELPTMQEAGVPGYVSEALHALFAPAGTPQPIINRLNQEVRRYLDSKEGKEAFFKGGIETAATSPEEMLKIMKSEMSIMGKILLAAGFKPPR